MRPRYLIALLAVVAMTPAWKSAGALAGILAAYIL